MSAQAPSPEQPLPPGLSLLERLPDELKLKVCDRFPSRLLADLPIEEQWIPCDCGDYDLSFISPMDDVPQLHYHIRISREKAISQGFDDEMLSLASTSVSLCNVFFGEYIKIYGLQNALYRSIEKGYVNLMHRAVQYGADINRAGDKHPYDMTALKMASRAENLPAILYLLRCGVEKADELVMDLLHEKDHPEVGNYERHIELFHLVKTSTHCRCKFVHVLMDALFDGNVSQEAKPLLPLRVQEALAPSSRHLWFILRTCMVSQWTCYCWDRGCPMRLVGLFRRHGARWMSCEAYELACQPADAAADNNDDDVVQFYYHNSFYETHLRELAALYPSPRPGFADLSRFEPSLPPRFDFFGDGPILSKPTVAGAMSSALVEYAAYRRDHCVPLITAILDAGVRPEEGDLTHAMRLAEDPATNALSVEIVRAILLHPGGGATAAAAQPGAMGTAMRLACMQTSADAAVGFVSLLLDANGGGGGAEAREPELQDEIQGAAEKWWVQAGWWSEGVFRRILDLLDGHGLDSGVSGEIRAILGLVRGPSGEEEFVEFVEI